jgi:hypothetical protein
MRSKVIGRTVAAVAAVAAAGAGLTGVPANAAAASIQVGYLNRSGGTEDMQASLIDLSNGKTYSANSGAATAVPAGRYAVGGYITEYPTLTVAVRVVQISGPTKLVFDTGKAGKVSFDVGDSNLTTSGLAVVPSVTVGHKQRAWIADNGIVWPGESTYVLADPSAAKAIRLGVHGVLTKRGADPSPVRYDLAKSFTGMPGDVTVKANPKQLARVDLDVATLDAAQTSNFGLEALNPDGSPITGIGVAVPALGKQTDYRTPGLQWTTRLTENSRDATEFLTENATPHVYAAGKSYQESWGHGVWSPRPNSPAIYLSGNNLRVGGGPPICAWAGNGVKLDECQAQQQDFSYTLYKDGKQVGSGQSISLPVDTVAAHWYTVELTASRQGHEIDLSTTVGAKWYFQAGGSTRTHPKPNVIVIVHGQPQPGSIRMLPAGLNNRNQAASNAATTVALSVADFPDVASMTLEWSGDGGKTWQNVAVTGSGNNRSAKVPALGKPGTVSLRVSAKSATGATVAETVINAYGVH